MDNDSPSTLGNDGLSSISDVETPLCISLREYEVRILLIIPGFPNAPLFGLQSGGKRTDSERNVRANNFCFSGFHAHHEHAKTHALPFVSYSAAVTEYSLHAFDASRSFTSFEQLSPIGFDSRHHQSIQALVVTKWTTHLKSRAICCRRHRN